VGGPVTVGAGQVLADGVVGGSVRPFNKYSLFPCSLRL
jgi:hypothetical protein